MGMKIKQESKVKSFFKRIFKLSRRRGKDGSWKHAKLESELYASSDSVLESWAKTLEENNKRNSQVLSGSIEELVPKDVGHCESVIPSELWQENKHDSTLDSVGSNTETKKKLKKKWKVKMNTDIKSGLLEVKEYEGVHDEKQSISDVSKNKNKKKNQKKASKKKSKEISEDLTDLGSGYKTDNQDQELIDVDLDLVLSSFPNLTPKSKRHFDAALDNRANEQFIRQGATSPHHQVEVVIQSTERLKGHHQNQKDVTNLKDVCTEGASLLEQHGDVYQKLLVDCETEVPKKITNKSSKKNKNKGNKKQRNNDETNVAITEIPAEKKSKKNKKNKKKSQLFEDRESRDITNQDHSLDQCLSEIEADHKDHTDTFKSSDNLQEPAKKRKKNKKKGNVRKPEDDFTEDSLERSRRRRHQEIWDADTITELDCPEEPVTKPKKKLRRRRLKLKFNKDKKRLDVKQYDELSGYGGEDGEKQDPDNTGKLTARNLGRRMWRACKTGWKYLRTGLITYTKTPTMNINFNPMVTPNYAEEYNPYGEGTSKTRYD